MRVPEISVTLSDVHHDGDLRSLVLGKIKVFLAQLFCEFLLSPTLYG